MTFRDWFDKWVDEHAKERDRYGRVTEVTKMPSYFECYEAGEREERARIKELISEHVGGEFIGWIDEGVQ